LPYPDIGRGRWSRQQVSRPAQPGEPEVSPFPLSLRDVEHVVLLPLMQAKDFDASVEPLRIFRLKLPCDAVVLLLSVF
jgi:hypothetical protein